jgi:hypothetical protein
MSETGRSIVIVVLQYSVVVKGIERKLTDSGYRTSILSENFEKISDKVLKKTANSNPLSDEEKNQVWNFVLLDRSTNRGYGNSIFPVKRRCIIGKDKGKKITIEIQDGDIQIISEASKSSFVPTCTKYAFLKYYNSASSSINYWDKKDAASYKENIISTLYDFIF